MYNRIEAKNQGLTANSSAAISTMRGRVGAPALIPHASRVYQGRRYYDEAIIEKLRTRLPDYLDALGVTLVPSGKRLIGLCPVHSDRNPSFAVFGDDHECCGCYPCGFKGDVFLTSQWLGRSNSFPMAVQDVARTLGVYLGDGVPELSTGRATRLPRPIERPKKSPSVSAPESKADSKIIQTARDMFAAAYSRGDAIIAQISDSLGIDRAVLGEVADGLSGLGLSHSHHGRTWLCYIYPEGVKWRNPDTFGPRFCWLTGAANAPWRAERSTADIETVYLTEGESDCLALIAAGLEDDNKTVCVASPGTGFQPKWAGLFTGKRVVLNFDPDDAGQKALPIVASYLRPYASSIEFLNLSTPSTDEHSLSK